MNFPEEDLEKFRPKVRFKVCYEVGFLCPDVEDIVQETMTRFLIATRDGKIRNTEAVGAFLNGICRNVISEYRRRSGRDEPMPEIVPEPPAKRLTESDLFELRQAIARGMEQLSHRDRQILHAFYLDEKAKEEILKLTGMTDENFRVALCRAKERFRKIYEEHTKHRGPSSH
jgi:RNA polymerase sigma-70 factor (ECF subfamily)